MCFEREKSVNETEKFTIVWTCEEKGRERSVKDGGGNGDTWKETSWKNMKRNSI